MYITFKIDYDNTSEGCDTGIDGTLTIRNEILGIISETVKGEKINDSNEVFQKYTDTTPIYTS